jgi:hypothetical protein
MMKHPFYRRIARIWECTNENCSLKPTANEGMTCPACFKARPGTKKLVVGARVQDRVQVVVVQAQDRVEAPTEHEDKPEEVKELETEHVLQDATVAEGAVAQEYPPEQEEEEKDALDDDDEEEAPVQVESDEPVPVDDTVVVEQVVPEPVRDAVQEQVVRDAVPDQIVVRAAAVPEQVTGVPRRGAFPHLTPTKKKRMSKGQTTTFRQQGNCRTCNKKTTYHCSLCLEERAGCVGTMPPAPWFCHYEKPRQCFSVHMLEAHP